MTAFEVTRRTALPADEAWRRVTDWPHHGTGVPFTTVHVLPGIDTGVGTQFVARTSLGRVGFDDPMEVVAWQPPTPERAGLARIEKLGPVLRGWAEIIVAAEPGGSALSWREQVEVPRLGPARGWPGQVIGRLLFGRLVDRLLSQD